MDVEVVQPRNQIFGKNGEEEDDIAITLWRLNR
jgi:hypothetical protein